MNNPEPAIERTWYAIAPNGGGEGPVTFRVGIPFERPGGDWAVNVSLGGIEPDPPMLFGVDGWQAVLIGMRFIGMRVADHSTRGWQFLWAKGGEAASPEDLGGG